MSKDAFIFLYSDMDLGGIQKYIYNSLVYFNKNGVDTYWLSPKKAVIDKGFSAEIAKVVRICGKPNAKQRGNLQSYDRVVAITFSLLQFEELKKKLAFLKNARFLYVIPHFKNPELHPEEFFVTKGFRRKVKGWSKEYYQDYVAQNQLFFITRKHADALCEHYGIDIAAKDELVGKKARELPLQDFGVIREKSKRQGFNIITVSRFEFPHKGYILGLVDDFAEFFKTRPDATLTVVGYGEGEDELRRKISALPTEVQSAISLPGRVSFSQLKEYYDKAHLSVAVAGSVFDGASFSVPTLVARHYCERCETYGQYAGCVDKTLSEDEGEPVLPYIKQVADMSAEEYSELCSKTYLTAEAVLAPNFKPMWMFDVKQSPDVHTGGGRVSFIRFKAWLWTWKNRFKLLFASPRTFLDKVKRKLKK